jgi:hypothetical protein
LQREHIEIAQALENERLDRFNLEERNAEQEKEMTTINGNRGN